MDRLFSLSGGGRRSTHVRERWMPEREKKQGGWVERRRLHSKKIDPLPSEKEIYEAGT